MKLVVNFIDDSMLRCFFLFVFYLKIFILRIECDVMFF